MSNVKRKGLILVLMIVVMITACCVTKFCCDASDARVTLKRQMVSPTAEWIDEHGKGFKSAQTYNIAILLDIERKRQAVTK